MFENMTSEDHERVARFGFLSYVLLIFLYSIPAIALLLIEGDFSYLGYGILSFASFIWGAVVFTNLFYHMIKEANREEN